MSACALRISNGETTKDGAQLTSVARRMLEHLLAGQNLRPQLELSKLDLNRTIGSVCDVDAEFVCLLDSPVRGLRDDLCL